MFYDLLKLILSASIGFILGAERNKQKKSGGSRTFALVCMASTLLTILSIRLSAAGNTFDFVRLLAYGIASIGFLGSGLITHKQQNNYGITSASCLWTLVPLGYCVGLGYYDLAISCALIVYFLLEIKYLRKRNDKTNS